jgi:Transposase IS116/IS110/IS902 family
MSRKVTAMALAADPAHRESCLKVASKRPHYSQLLSVPGFGKILAMTILLEVAEIARFPSAGGFCQLLPHCGRSKNQQREEESRQQPQVRQSLLGVGLY